MSHETGRAEPPERNRRMDGEDIRRTVLNAARELLLADDMPVDARIPSLEEIIARNHLPRSSVYRMFRGRDGKYGLAVLRAVIEDDLFATAAVVGAVTARIARQELPTSRNEVVAGVGNVLVNTPNHRLITRVGEVVASLALGNNVSDSPGGSLRAAQAYHVEALGGMYASMHHTFGERVPNLARYTGACATIAEGFARATYGPVSPEVQGAQFVALADQYAVPNR